MFTFCAHNEVCICNNCVSIDVHTMKNMLVFTPNEMLFREN